MFHVFSEILRYGKESNSERYPYADTILEVRTTLRMESAELTDYRIFIVPSLAGLMGSLKGIFILPNLNGEAL